MATQELWKQAYDFQKRYNDFHEIVRCSRGVEVTKKLLMDNKVNYVVLDEKLREMRFNMSCLDHFATRHLFENDNFEILRVNL